MLGAGLSKPRGQINLAGWRVMVGNGYFRLMLRCSSAGHRLGGREGRRRLQSSLWEGVLAEQISGLWDGRILGKLERGWGEKLSWLWSEQKNRGEGCRRQGEKCIQGPDTICSLGKWLFFFFFFFAFYSQWDRKPWGWLFFFLLYHATF